MSIYRLASYFDGVAEFEYYGDLPFGVSATLLVVAGVIDKQGFNIELPYECIKDLDFVRTVIGGAPQPHVFTKEKTFSNGKKTKDTASVPCDPDSDFCPTTNSSTATVDEPVARTAKEDGESVPEAKRELDRAIWRKRANLV